MSTSLAVAENRVASFNYVLSDSDGTQLESSHGKDPVAALIGHGNVMPDLEKALVGRRPGERFELTLAPDQAYGDRREGHTQRISKKYVNNAARLKPGMQAQVQTESGPRTVTVLKVGGKMLDVDLNHPFAGKTVTFAIELVDVREASAEEISHGHAHGSGGHHH